MNRLQVLVVARPLVVEGSTQEMISSPELEQERKESRVS